MIVTSDRRKLSLHLAGEENNPFVAFQNLAETATLYGSLVLPDGARANAVSGTTFDYWRPDVLGSEAILAADLGATKTVSFAGIAAHTLGQLGASAVIEHSADGSTWTDSGAGAVSPTEDAACGWRMEPVAARYWRLRVTGFAPLDPVAVGVFFLGNELIMPDRTISGAAPAIRATEVQLQSNVSVGGNILGSQVIAQGSTVSLSLQRVPADFVRDSLPPFMDHFGAGKPFFYGWRPTEYPADLHYCWRSGGPIRPAMTGTLRFMSVEWEARAYVG